MRDLALLFGCFVELGFFVVVQTPPENLEDLRRRFASGANDEDAIEALLVGAIACRKSGFDVVTSRAGFALFFARPRGRLGRCRIRGMRVTDSRMTAKGFEPIRFRKIFPNFITSSQESGLVEDRPTIRH